MRGDQDNVPCCSICEKVEVDLTKLRFCESCLQVTFQRAIHLQTVCSSCSNFKSPIPMKGKYTRCRVCARCIRNYSNCDLSLTKDDFYVPDEPLPEEAFANFAESRCCKDLYVSVSMML